MRERASRLLSPWLLLAAAVAVSALARTLAGLRIDGLWIVPDEMIWGSLGRSLWEHGSLRLFGADAPFFGFVYPALAGAPLALAGLDVGYDALKGLQAVVMSLAAVPVLLWCRRLAGGAWALVAAALTLAVPELVYTGMLLSEVAFYPVAVLAAWATAAALERPTPVRQALLVGVMALAVATRLQALVLPLALVAAIGFHALLVRDRRQLRLLWPAVAALALLGAAWIAWRAAAAGSFSGVLGGYAPAAEAPYEAGAVARSVLDHAGALALALGVVPVAALVALLRGERSRAESAYLATTLAFVPLLLVQAAAYSSVYVRGLSTRYLLPLAPLIFIGFSVWLARRAPRSQLGVALVALAILALLVTMPLEELVAQEAAWQSPAVIPLLWLEERAGGAGMELAVWSAAAAALALFALLPRRAAPALAGVTAGVLAFSSFAATEEVQQNVAFDQRNLLGGERGWIAESADGPTAYLDVGTGYSNLVWHELFWNDNLRHVYVTGAGPQPAYPLQQRVVIATDGTLLVGGDEPVPVDFAVAPSTAHLVGEAVAEIEIREYEGSGLTLWRLQRPARLSWSLAGVRHDGDMHEPARLTAYDCQGGRLELTLLPKGSTRVELRVNRRTVQVLDDIAGKEFVHATVRPPGKAEQCLFEVIPDGLLGSTRFEFVRD